MESFAWARRTFRFLGIDQAVAFTLAGHLWMVVTGPLLLVLIVGRLSDSERGVLFNFVDITNLQFVIATAVGTVILQLASRERAFLTPRPDGLLGGDEAAKARLGALFRIGLCLFVAVATAAAIVLLPVGWGIFDSARGLERVDWQLSWLLSVLAAAVQGLVICLFQFLFGIGHVAPTARINALQQAIMIAGLALGLVLGARLLAHPLSVMAGLSLSILWLMMTRRRLLADLWSTPRHGVEFRWMADVWPMQWRVSISWISIVLVVQIVGPIMMLFKGAQVAGRVGLSMYILRMVQVMGTGWVGTKVPTFGMLAAQKKWPELDRAFAFVLLRSLGLMTLLCGLVVSAAAALHFWHGSLLQQGAVALLGDDPMVRLDQMARESGSGSGSPLLAPLPLALLALATLAVHVVSTGMAYLRAHGREPSLPLAVGLALAVTTTLVLTGRYGTVDMMIAGYAFWVFALGLGGGSLLFLHKRRQWHRPGPSNHAG